MISLIGLLIIIGFSYQKMSSTFEHYNISSAQKNSKNLGHVLYKIESHTLIDQNT